VGLFATTFYTFLPCFLFILAGAPIIERTQDNQKVKSLLAIVTAAVVGVVLNLTVYFARAVIFPENLASGEVNYFGLAWTIVSCVALYRFGLNMIKWIGVSAIAGLGYFLLRQYLSEN
jgi:chromate transporter